ncbi:MAG: protein kinase domain-containing protein [Waterburya sp.]
MSYCFNPYCSKPNNHERQDKCNSCGANLLLHQRYRGIKLLGKSQLALTIEVTDNQDNQPSDSKVLKILLTDYPKAVELFQQEAQVLAQMNHAGIPKLSGDGYFSFQPQWQKNPVHCLVIAKIAGLDLEQWLEQGQDKPLSLQQAQDWLKQLLDIISQLHQQQYFHRDIKPSNIILQPNGKLVLIDFGAARKVTHTYRGKVGVNQGVTSIGTPGYIAPEQIDGAALPQSDFFSLGRTLVHLLTGKHPQELAKNLDTRELIWRDRAPQVSVSFADLLDEMMSYLPSQRPVNVEAIINNLMKAEQFPQQPLFKLPIKLKLSWLMLFGVMFLPFSILGLFSLGSNLKQEVTAGNVANIPLCNNLTCVNRDPIDNKCDRDAQTITSNTGNYVFEQKLIPYRLEIRYSQKCNAVWAKSEAPYRSVHYIEDDQGKKYGTAIVPIDQWDEHYADMAPGKDIQVRACAKPPTGEKSCTNFVQL